MKMEDDYMSDVYLKVASTQATLNVSKPSIRKRKMEKLKRESDLRSKMKPVRVLEKEQRDIGLSTGLSSDNLGFKLMAKMGYKKGEGLGSKGEGRAEPIPFQLKSNRGGLGKAASDEEKRKRRQNFLKVVAEKKCKIEHIQHQDFRSRMSGKYATRQTEIDIVKSQKACHQLDGSNKIVEPLYNFFWPKYVTAEPDDIEEDKEEEEVVEEYTSEEKLTILTDYLRQEYFYCIWCASKFLDEKDLSANCPGDTALSHSEDGW